MSEDQHKRALSLQDATEVALKKVEQEEGWAPAQMIGEGKTTNDSFEITVWKTPKTPGGFRLVVVSAGGKVTAYYRGK